MYDVIVTGAGPAGSTATKALADKGYKVLVVEKFKVGQVLFVGKIIGFLNPMG